MEIGLFSEENKQWEKEYLSGFELDVELFEQLGLKIVQIVPDRNSYRLETDKGFFSLKKLRFPLEEMNFVQDCLGYLKAKGFTNVLELILRPDGREYLDYEGESYYLARWIDGRECDYQSSYDIVKASELLARFHACAKGFKPANIPNHRNLLGKWPEYFKSQIDEMYAIKHFAMGKAVKNQVDVVFLKYASQCIEDSEKAWELLQKSNYNNIVERTRGEGGFIHHDLLHNSMVYTFGGDVCLIDFEFFAVDTRVHDIGSFMLRCMKRGDWNLEYARLIVESYDKINPLKKEELNLLVPLMLFPQEFRLQARQYLAPDRELDGQDYLEKLDPDSESNQKRRSFIERLGEII